MRIVCLSDTHNRHDRIEVPEGDLLLVATGFLGAGGHYCSTRAFRVADISAVQSVRFLDLIWASLLGLAIFGTVPEGWTVAGGVVILVSTLWLARREASAPPRLAG